MILWLGTLSVAAKIGFTNLTHNMISCLQLNMRVRSDFLMG